MDRENAKNLIRQRIKCTDYLEKSKGNDMYCCPYCNSGKGPNGTGALKYYPETNTFYCHACHKGGDAIDLYQNSTGKDYNEALTALANGMGITIDYHGPNAKTGSKTPDKYKSSLSAEKKPLKEDNRTAEEPAAPSVNVEEFIYRDYFFQCADNLQKYPEALEYLKSRGISAETAEHYFLGFDPKADPANAPGAMDDKGKLFPTPRIIIPNDVKCTNYVARAIDDNAVDKDYRKMFPNMKKGAGPVTLFNGNILKYPGDAKTIFITEAAFDALSIIECGYPAVALNGAGNTDKVIDALEENPPKATFIICLDDDKRGKEAAEKLDTEMNRLNISHIKGDICCGFKDPNEALTKDPEGFKEALNTAVFETSNKPDAVSFYIDNFMAGDIASFKSEIKTGFPNLDKQTGGIYSGLYVIAAISSLGKTTFTAQLADNIAASGTDVIFFSMEQSKLEIVSKSIARRTYIDNPSTAVNSLSIRKGYLPQQVQEAALQYKHEVGDRMSVIEGNFRCDISFIGDYIREYIRKNGTQPVVVVDYLQVLQPGDKRQNTKESIDLSVTELKRISRELNLPIIVISSINRANYLTPVDFESLKESGNIEFTADVVWGLQLQCLNDDTFSKKDNIKDRREAVKAAKAENPRKIELVCLKNRFGCATFSAYFNYYPANDFFEECSTDDVVFSCPNNGRKAGRKL